ncbi:MAG: phosphatase PAP2 family protein [Spirochaetota bacterium]
MQENLLLYFQSIATPVLDVLVQLLTMAGEQVVFVAVISYIFWNISKSAGYALTYTLMFSSIVNGILKLVFHTPRPYRVMEGIEGKRLHTAEGFAFPSGHTQGATTFYISLSVFLGKKRWLVAALFVSLLVGLSRIYLGVHWPVDVLGGYILGLLIASAMYHALQQLYRRKYAVQRLNKVTAVLSLAGLILCLLVIPSHGSAAETLSGLIKLLAITCGFSLGTYLEQRHLNFSVAGAPMVKLLRYVMGLLGALLLLYGLKAVLPDTPLPTALRYAATGFWAFYLYPMIGSKVSVDTQRTKLFSSRGQEGTSTTYEH